VARNLGIPADARPGADRADRDEIPFNAPPDPSTRIAIDDGRDVLGSSYSDGTIPNCDQVYRCGRRVFAAIREGGEVPGTDGDAMRIWR